MPAVSVSAGRDDGRARKPCRPRPPDRRASAACLAFSRCSGPFASRALPLPLLTCRVCVYRTKAAAATDAAASPPTLLSPLSPPSRAEPSQVKSSRVGSSRVGSSQVESSRVQSSRVESSQAAAAAAVRRRDRRSSQRCCRCSRLPPLVRTHPAVSQVTSLHLEGHTDITDITICRALVPGSSVTS